jgi:transcriptional regulator with XRE-family HTH domain
MNKDLYNLEEIKNEKSVFCKKIRLKRLALNYTQESMAEMLKLNVKTYRKIEKGQEIANFESILILMKIVNIADN